MAIDKISVQFPQIEGIRPSGIEKPQATEKTKSSTQPGSFGEMLTKAIGEVNELQLEADQKVEGMIVGDKGVTPHQAMIALEKADVSFQIMNQVRSKIIRAYEEIMRTQI